MCELDENIVVDFETGRDCRTRYIQCRTCKQRKCVDDFISKHSKRIYTKSCRACLDASNKYRLRRKECVQEVFLWKGS